MTTDNAEQGIDANTDLVERSEEQQTDVATGGEPLVITRDMFDNAFDNAPNVREYTGDIEIIDKTELIGKKLLILGWEWRQQEGTDREFVTVHVMTAEGRAGLFNDGGVGISPVLEKMEQEIGNPINTGTPVACSKGLRVSNYVGPYGAAQTFYLA